MTFTNEERREVAARLRDLDEATATLSQVYSRQEYDAMVLRAIRAVVGEGDIFHLLADLIDRPTCKKEEHDEYYWRCTRCGGFICWDAVTDCCGVIPTRYCPNCGAEVQE